MTTSISHWPLAAFLTSLPLDFAAAVKQAADLGFTHVEVVAETDRPASHLEALADSGVVVACASLGRGLPQGHTLDAADAQVRRTTLRLLERQISDAARLGATVAYIVPGTQADETSLTYFAESCTLLADFAAGRMVRLCVEHVPGRALPTAAATLDFLERLGHPNLALLLDVGHCLISGEDMAAMVRRANQRLGHVHLDDNDGVGDLHWPLLTGRLTERHLRDLFAALRAANYLGAFSLELKPGKADPVAALRDSKKVVEQAAGGPIDGH
jgi:sugar phosphate isomerase/epimerase